MVWVRRHNYREKLFCIVCLSILLFSQVIFTPCTVYAENEQPQITCQSAILMEASTGTVIYEKNADEIRSPASITKIMTLLLTFEALESGKINLTDEVMTSAHAKSMGGSQVFLEEGEIQTVDTLIKCIAVASGNDASVAIAEFISGTEAGFVEKMNEKASQLGMNNTHFVDCCGLSNDDEHHTTARDVAIMSKELITKFPAIYDYSKIWMEDIVHTTKQGTKNFTLSSTNKLLKQYQWTTGLKTGSTNKAKYCLSATACKDDMNLIAVIMGAPDFKVRFAEAKVLLEYGFHVTHLYKDPNQDLSQESVPVYGGKKKEVFCYAQGPFQYLLFSEQEDNQILKHIEWEERINAPVNKGDIIGKIIYELNGKIIGEVPLLAIETIDKATFIDYFYEIIQFLLID